eukprot:CAMPEP_0198594674 /NCGR_PEP_ID=MMETSP1462-20131121/140940_1 /TAXON_ID=1333877 /ORGANISM="Brandtodinium nutriculum, Strain RCC3387" /LENGTH=670 /DNA_ID=CAMNT_0044326291 /DNA_START=1 /DNA_END=2009 /DNA_ORIENTATION=+
MVAWERQIEERSVPQWRDKYVAYAKLKRMLDQVMVQADDTDDAADHMRRALTDGVHTPQKDKGKDFEAALLAERETRRQEFMDEVYAELRRSAAWYDDAATALESRVREATTALGPGAGAAGLKPCSAHALEDIERLHLESAQLTEFVLLNVEGLRKIVKKMDKQCGRSDQKNFVEKHLKRSAFAVMNEPTNPFGGQRAKACRKELETYLSPEKIQELRSKAIELRHGAGASRVMGIKRAGLFSLLAIIVVPLSAPLLPGADRAQRCVGLLVFTVSMWVFEAAPFEGTALLVPPLAVLANVLEGTRQEQAKRVLASVFTDSLYLVLCGFVISSVFTTCQLECRTASFLQRRLGGKPFLFMLAIMFLGLGLSALLSNVTAPLLLIEVLKPLLRDMPTDCRYSRALLLGLAFSCNIGGMTTPISSPQNIAALTILQQHGGNISWGQWLSVSVPFCSVGVLLAWAVLIVVHRFDASTEERARGNGSARTAIKLPNVVFDSEALSGSKALSLASACMVLGAFACKPVADAFGGTSVVAMFYIAVALATGIITRQTFNSYSWHLMFLIGGGSALGFAVNESGLLAIITDAAREHLASAPFVLVIQLVCALVCATTFVSHTVAALVFMPLVVKLGADAGVPELAVFVCGLACSVACALPMTSFPNVNSLMATDDSG